MDIALAVRTRWWASPTARATSGSRIASRTMNGRRVPPNTVCLDMGAYEFPLPAEMPGDLDDDCDVDTDDVAIFVGCMTPPSVPQYNPACAKARLDEDLDVDQADFGLIQRCYSGPDIPGDPRCAD